MRLTKRSLRRSFFYRSSPFERLKSGAPVLVPATSKINPKTVQAEAGMGDGSLYYYPELLAEIKTEKQRQAQLSIDDGVKIGAVSASEQIASLREKNKSLMRERDAAIGSQAELAYCVFQSLEIRGVIVNLVSKS